MSTWAYDSVRCTRCGHRFPEELLRRLMCDACHEEYIPVRGVIRVTQL